MKNQTEKKLFAFKLAEKAETTQRVTQWKVRENVATAGCSGLDWRFNSAQFGRDGGAYC